MEELFFQAGSIAVQINFRMSAACYRAVSVIFIRLEVIWLRYNVQNLNM